MKAQSRKLEKLAGLVILFFAFLTISLDAEASYNRYNRNNARRTINKTAYIINEAYSIANYYGYWSGSDLSRALYYNEYAERQYYRRNYRRAVHYSLKARQYALMVIDGCDAYWDYFYYENYGWSRNYGYNPYYSGSYSGNHYGNYNYYYNRYYSNSHNNYSSNPNYNPRRPNTYNDGRGGSGRSGAFDPNKPSGGGTQTGHLKDDASFKNINADTFFDKDELGLMDELPNDNLMEEGFKKDNRNISFDDNSLRSNTKLIENNRTRSEEFKKEVPQAQRTPIKLQEPRNIDEVIKTRGSIEGNRNIDNNRRTIDNNRNIDNNRTIDNRNVFESREGEPVLKGEPVLRNNNTNTRINTNTNRREPQRQVSPTSPTKTNTRTINKSEPSTRKSNPKVKSSNKNTRTEKSGTTRSTNRSSGSNIRSR